MNFTPNIIYAWHRSYKVLVISICADCHCFLQCSLHSTALSDACCELTSIHSVGVLNHSTYLTVHFIHLPTCCEISSIYSIGVEHWQLGSFCHSQTSRISIVPLSLDTYCESSSIHSVEAIGHIVYSITGSPSPPLLRVVSQSLYTASESTTFRFTSVHIPFAP